MVMEDEIESGYTIGKIRSQVLVHHGGDHITFAFAYTVSRFIIAMYVFNYNAMA